MLAWTFFSKTILIISILIPNVSASESMTAKLGPADTKDLQRIEAHLNDIENLRARFVQVSSNGQIATGKLIIARPGKMRLEYDPPTPIMLIANGDFLVYIDKELQQTTHFFVDKTPLGFLLKNEIKLSGDITVTKFSRGSNTLIASISKSRDPEKGSITVVFSDKPLALKKWIVKDAQGIKTTVTLNNPERITKVDPSIFDLNNAPKSQ